MPRDPSGPPVATIGCLMVPLGAFSMAMVGVLASKLVAVLTKAKCDVAEIPTCDWHVYAAWGALFGAVTLPLLVVRRLRQAAPHGDSTRG
jgi:hypothetical protein